MAITRFTAQWVDVPHEPGERFRFKMPNWAMLQEARQERSRGVLTAARAEREAAGPEIVAEWQARAVEQRAKADAAAAAAAEDGTTAIVPVRTAEEVLNEYDRLLLLRAGIDAWTYCEPQLDADGNPRVGADGRIVFDRSKPIPVTVENIRDLDEQTQTWAGLTLLALRDSGFRPIMPEVVQNAHGTVIDVRPGTDADPFAYSSTSNGTSMASRV